MNQQWNILCHGYDTPWNMLKQDKSFCFMTIKHFESGWNSVFHSHETSWIRSNETVVNHEDIITAYIIIYLFNVAIYIIRPFIPLNYFWRNTRHSTSSNVALPNRYCVCKWEWRHPKFKLNIASILTFVCILIQLLIFYWWYFKVFHHSDSCCFKLFQGVSLPCFILFRDHETGAVERALMMANSTSRYN